MQRGASAWVLNTAGKSSLGNYNPDFKGFLDVKALRSGLKCSKDWLDRSAGADKTDPQQINSLF